jgi:hypothetical protein
LGLATPSLALPLSPGDRLNIFIREGQGFSGLYEINLDGTLNIPYLHPLYVSGFSLRVIRRKNWSQKGQRKKVTGQHSSGKVNLMGAVRFHDRKPIQAI